MMKLFRYILLVGAMMVGVGVRGQIPNNKLCSSGILTNGSFIFCSGDSLKLYVNNDTSNSKYFFQWMKGSYPALTPIAGAVNASLVIKAGGDFYIRIIDTLAKDTCFRVQNVTMNPKPNANFTFTPNSGCGRTEVQFTNAAQTITNLQYMWNMGDPSSGGSNTPNTANPQYIYIPSASGAAQTYTISLTLKDANTNCSSNYSQTISIGAGPDAKLNETNTSKYNGKVTFVKCSGILNYNFSFSNATTTPASNISSYKIIWGDATPDSIFTSFPTTISHSYARGLYLLKFIITGTNNCVNSKEYYVFLGNTPGISLGVPPSIKICSGDSLIFRIKDYSTNPPGTTYVLHFSDTNSDTTFNHPPPDSIIHKFNSSSCGFTDILNNPNSFYVDIKAINPCDSAGQPVPKIQVYRKPIAKFTVSPYDSSCVGQSLNFTNTSNFTTFPLALNNCNSGNIVWKILPNAGWTKSSGSLGNDNSFDPDPFYWTSGSADLGINFSSPGTYNVIQKLGSFNNCNYYDSLVKTICINPTPTSFFSLTKSTICLGDTATAISTASTPLCGKTTYQWTISYTAISGCNPSSSSFSYTKGSDTSANPQFRFNNPGTYTISLVTGIKGITCTSTSSSQTITVKGKPNISINNIASVCQGENITPTAAAPTCYVSSATYNWAFAGGIPATANTLVPGSIKMDSSGINKVVSLSATNECGTSTTQTTVTIKPIPAIGSAIPHNPSQCTLQNGSIDLTGLITGTSYTITYTKNGGATITITKVAAAGMVTITGLGSGVYDNIKVSIVGDGCFSNPVGPVSLSDPNPPATPTVGSNSPLCSGATLNLTSSTTTTGAITYSWSGPNGFSSSAQNPTKSNINVNATGTYSVTATLAGCTSAAGTVAVTVNQTPATPTVSYNSPICSGATLNLTSNTTTTGTINYAWTGPNSFASALQNPSITNITTAASGSYSVIATATPSNCSSVAGTLNVTINPTPNISNSSATNPSSCSGTDGKIILEGLASNTTYFVVYTKGATTIAPISIQSNASGILTINGLAAGTYTNVSVTLNGCPSNIVGPFTLVDPNPPATPTITAVANICSGKNLTLTATTSTSGTATYNWSGPIGFTATGTPVNINNIPTKLGGVYNVTVTINGCTSSAGTATVAVDSTPLAPTIIGNTTICSDSTLKLTATTASSGTMTYNWTVPVGSFINTPNITINNVIATNAGVYSVTATSVANCASTNGTATVTINPTPIISNFNFKNPTACATATGSISFNVTTNGTHIVTYTKNGSSQNISLSPVAGVIIIPALTAGVYDNITVSLAFCPSNKLGPVTLFDPNPPATPIIATVPNICSGKNLTININSPIVGATYNWTSTSGFSGVGATINIANVPTNLAGTFSVTVTDSGCISNAGNVTVAIDSTPLAPTITGNTAICSDSTLKLTATTVSAGTMTYNWIVPVGSFVNTPNVVINNVAAANAGTYSVTAKSSANCISANGSTNITVNPTPVISSLTFKNPTACATATGNISFNVTPATGNYIVNYKKDGVGSTRNIVAIGGTITIDTLRAGNYTNIFVTTASGCPSNILGALVLIDPNPPVTPIIAAVSNVCSGKNLVINVTSPIVGATYNWTSTSGFNGVGVNINIANVPTKLAGTFSVTVTDSGCISNAGTVSVAIDSTPLAPIIAGNTAICSDSTLKLTATTASSGTMTYNWTVPVVSFINTPNVVINNVTAANAGAYNVTATSTINTNCVSAIATANVIVYQSPTVNVKDSTNPNQCATPSGFINLNGLNANTSYNIFYTINSSIKMQTQTSNGSGVLRLDTLRAGIYSNIYVTLNGCPSKPVRDVTLVDPNPPATPVIISVDSLCSGNNLVLTASNPIANAIYTWTKPNNTTTTGTSLIINSISVAESGVYKLYVTLNLCKSNDTTHIIRVDSTPVAPIIVTNSPVCSDSTIVLQASTVSPGNMIYSWAGVNSFTSSLQNPTIPNAQLINAGSYSVFATSQIGNCVSATTNQNVVVNASPDVTAMPDTTYKDGVPSGLIVFNGNIPNTTFSWTNSNPSIGLSANGTGDIISFTTSNTTPFPIFGIITVTPSTSFCTGKPITFKITVNPTPRLTSPFADTICTDNLWLYQATSATPNVTFTWVRNAVAGISNPASASTDSSGIISETPTNTTSQPITVPYIFKLYSLGSVNIDTVKLTVNPDAKASYTFKNDKLCAPGIIDTANIKLQPFALANGSFEWYADGVLIGTGLQFPTYTILNNGDTVKIKLKANSLYGCKSDSFEHSFYNVKTPVASFTKSIASGCGPLVVDFQNTTTPLAYPTYKWDFGNGTTSTQQSPANIIFKEDTSNRRVDTTYYIKLTAYTECDSISYTDSVTVFPKPKALFQPDTTVGCSIFKFRAFNNSWGQHNTYTWDFGDSTTLVIDTAYGYYYHNFYTAVTDTFNVKLKAVNKCGSDSFEVKIVVFPNTIVPKLIVDGSSNYGCAPVQVRFVNNTVGANKFTIKFGDGSLPYLSNKNPDTVYHTYQTGGTYTATMKAENGCTDSTVSLALIFYDKPAANFSTTFNQYCKKETIQFKNLSDSTLSFEWLFGDGGTSTNLHPTHQYLNAGNYTITLIAKSTNPTGAVCTDTIRKTITVHELPVSSFTNNAAIQNCQPYYFVGIVNLLPSEIANWIFSDPFSNDTTQAGNVGVHTFKQVGIYKVRLVTINVHGCTDTSSTNVKVIETPKVAFVMSDTISCIPGKSVLCTNQTTYSSADAVNYQWYVNGILQATTKDFNYNFNVPVTITVAANFVVKLVAINSYGCRDSATKLFVIYPKAQPSFAINANVGCVPFNLQFNNTSKYANLFNWYLDGQLFSTSAVPNPIVLSNPATTYNIKLVANHTLGCGADSITKKFTTYTKPVADFLIPNKNSCTGILNIQCFDLSSVVGASITKWNWIFGDGATDTIKNPTHTYTTAGHFNVGLVATDNRGCKSDIAYQRVANFGKPKANFSVGNVCVKNPLLPLNLSTPGLGSTAITNYLWNFGDGNYLTGSQPIYVYQNEGNYTLTLIVTSDSSCVADTMMKTVTVYGKPIADFKFENNCVKENTIFTNTSLYGFGQTAIGISKWTFGDGGTILNFNAAHIFNATGDYVVQLAVSGNRCPNLTDSIKKVVTVHKPRDPVIYPRIEGVRGTPIQLFALSGGVQYNWIPITGLDNAGIQNPIGNYAVANPNIISYTISITDSLGCKVKDRQEVWLFADADIFVPTAFTPNGDGANDILKPLYVNIAKVNYFRIFDRWGKVVFETSDMGKAWDGTLNGANLPMETYSWMIGAITQQGKELIRKGNTTLIRN